MSNNELGGNLVSLIEWEEVVESSGALSDAGSTYGHHREPIVLEHENHDEGDVYYLDSGTALHYRGERRVDVYA